MKTMRRGFTLLEMLVSLALLGILMVSLSSFLFSMSELWGGGRDKRLFDQHARAATALVRNAFEQATYGPSASGVALKDVDDGAGTTKPRLSFLLADAGRLAEKPLLAALEKHLAEKFSVDKLLFKSSLPHLALDYERATRAGVRRRKVPAFRQKIGLIFQNFNLLPVLTEALSVIEATLATPQPATAPGLVRAERRRFAPTQVLALPQFEATRLHEGFAPTLAATQLVPLP